MKKSLVISEKEKYGPTEVSKPIPPGGTVKPKDRKFAPSITLVGKQVDAFCACSLKVGEKGTATVDYVIKAVGGGGDHYGDELPAAKPEKKVTLALTHVHSDKEGEDEEAGEDPAEEADETPGEEDSEETDEKPDAPTAAEKDKVSPTDAFGDDDHDGA